MRRNRLDGEPNQLEQELENFEQAALQIKPSPGEIPNLPGIEIAGYSSPLGGAIGGDHIIYIDFNQRYDLPHRAERAELLDKPEIAAKLRLLSGRAGLLVADVSGHRITDALIAAMLHQAFLLGVNYELDLYGEVTTRLFEHINTRFYKSTAINKFVTMIYGEISVDGKFRFISAGHQPPDVYSREFEHFMPISNDRLVTFPPVGVLPSDIDDDENPQTSDPHKKIYQVNEIELLAEGDILILHTDGFDDHADGRFYPAEVERILAENADMSARDLCDTLGKALHDFAPPVDDVSFVLIKKTA